MKYLQYRNQFLNEGFSSKSLSKTLGWLSKSGLKSSSTKFLEDLKKFCEKTSIPLSEISDQWFKTNVLTRDAVKLRAPEEVGNPSGLWCLKFWFSAEEGYMGYTVTPKRSKELFKIKNRQIGESFNDDEIRHLLNNDNIDNIKTGELHPVIDYKSLKTGDIVCGYNSRGDNIDVLRWFKVFLAHNENGVSDGGFLINPYVDGSNASRSYRFDENGREIDMENYFGEYYNPGRGSSSWQFIDSGGYPEPDHCRLHLYKPSDKPLHVFSAEKEKGKEEELDIYSFNLSYEIKDGDTNRVDQLNGEYNNWSIDNNRFKNSDFSIIFFADEFLPNQEMSLKDIRTDRTKSKEGALALMSDDDIKKINVEKRINYLIDKFDLDPSIKMDNMTNLNSILMKMFLDDFILFKVFYGYDTDIIKYLYRFFDHCQNAIWRDASPEDFKNAVQPHINDIKRSYRSLLQRYSQINFFKENYDFILKSDNKYVVDFFKEFMIISKKLKDKIRSKNIVNLYDASIIIDRLHNIRRSETGTSRLSYYFDACIGNFISKENVLSFIDRIDENEFNISKKALKFIERQVDMI